MPSASTRNQSYVYDAMGNRSSRSIVQSVNGGASSTTNILSTHNRLNQLTAQSVSLNGAPSSTSSFAYDASGNMTAQNTGSGGGTYVYDDADRLVSLTQKDPTSGVFSKKSEFVYDGQDRKVISREYSWNTQTSSWTLTEEKRRVYDGMEVMQERDGQNVTKVNYVRAGNVGGLLGRVDGSGSYYYSYDGSGNVVSLTDANKQLVAEYAYDAYGNTLRATGAMAGVNSYRYSTKELHAASGLYDYGYRFYSPGLGRWINRDPIEEEDDINLYRFVGNEPTNWIDEYGLQRAGKKALKALCPGARDSFNKTGIPSANIFKSIDKRATPKSGRTHVAPYGKGNTLDISPDYDLSEKAGFKQLYKWLPKLRENGWAAWVRGDDADEKSFSPHIHAVYMGYPNPNNKWQVDQYKKGQNGLSRIRKDTTNPIRIR